MSILRRRDQIFAYLLAVVVDDAAQGVTHVVRGADLLDNTPRQIYLQRALGLQQPAYAHVPVLTEPDGAKLAKSRRSVRLAADSALAAAPGGVSRCWGLRLPIGWQGPAWRKPGTGRSGTGISGTGSEAA